MFSRETQTPNRVDFIYEEKPQELINDKEEEELTEYQQTMNAERENLAYGDSMDVKGTAHD
jgi:hypothetical protein